jgi:subtilisin-like proprotein convertase family protein
VKSLSIGALSLVLVSVFAPSAPADGPTPRTTAPSYVSQTSGAIHLPVPDGGGVPGVVSSDIDVFDGGLILDLDVGVTITHSYVGDLIVTLTHVDTGTSVTIIDRPGSGACSENDILATLDDEAAFPVEDVCPLQTPTIWGSYTPNNPLSAFDGEDRTGTWRLTVADAVSFDTGFLESWTIYFGVRLCGGIPATIIGTPGDDHLIGTPGGDVIVGRAGADIIEGKGGDDVICGGAGRDTLIGGSGNDALLGLKGNDTLIGGGEDNQLSGGAGNDTADYSTIGVGVTVDLSGGLALGWVGSDTLSSVEKVIGSPYSDTIYGSAKANVLRGGGGNDTLVGRGSADRLFGQAGDDTLEGGKGHDYLVGGTGVDSVDGGQGTDTCSGEILQTCEL